MRIYIDAGSPQDKIEEMTPTQLASEYVLGEIYLECKVNDAPPIAVAEPDVGGGGFTVTLTSAVHFDTLPELAAFFEEISEVTGCLLSKEAAWQISAQAYLYGAPVKPL